MSQSNAQGGLADLGNLSLPPQPTRPASTSPGHPKRKVPGNRARTQNVRTTNASKGSRKHVATIAAVIASVLIVVAVGSTAVWYIVSKTDLVPAAIVPESIATAFDSADTIVASANENDRELKRLVDALPSGSVSQEKIDEILEVSERSRRLLLRAVNVNLLSPSEANSIVDLDSQGNVIGPLTEEETDAMRDRLLTLPKNNQITLLNLVSGGLKSNEFVREYLHFGHLEIPTAANKGEQINARRVELLRDLNRLGADVILSADPDRGKVAKTKEESKQYLNELYGPIEDDVADLAEQMHLLAEARYQLPKAEVGDPDHLDEVLYYTQQIHGKVFIANLALVQHGASIVDPLGDFLRASADVDAARFGGKPSRIAKADEEKARQAEAERLREEERQAKLAQAKREREAAANKAAEEQRAKQQQLAGSDSKAEDSVAANKGPRASGPAAAFGGGRGGPPVGFGGRGGFAGRGDTNRAGAPNFRGPPGGSMEGQSSRGPGRGPTQGGFGPRGPRQGNGAQANPMGRGGSPPAANFETGTTIQMTGVENFDTLKYSKRFSEALGGSASVQIRNGDMVIRLQYDGPLKAVSELIDFGEVVKTDEATRTITVRAIVPTDDSN